MTDYTKLKKSELIEMLNQEMAKHKITAEYLGDVVNESNTDENKINLLRAELHLAERTILRLTTNETIRQDMGE